MLDVERSILINTINMTEDDWIDSREARRLLGVRAQTLYAYASRGMLRRVPDPQDGRRSLYSRSEVECQAALNSRSRKLADVASTTIDWGEPVLDSAISCVRDGRLFYRGQDVVPLAETADLETVAKILIGEEPSSHSMRCGSPVPAGTTGVERLFQMLAVAASSARPAADFGASARGDEAAGLLDRVADAIAGKTMPGAIHRRLAAGWGLDPDGYDSDTIRRCLVLLADHELNASTFAARVTASTGASLAAALLSGLCALTGPRHGGMGADVQALIAQARRVGAEAAVKAWFDERGALPGFGHPLYPLGDLRAACMLGAVKVAPIHAQVMDAAFRISASQPNVDFALAAACDALCFPAEAAFGLFAVGRSAGWLAHAIEQQESGKLIRPRARYTG